MIQNLLDVFRIFCLIAWVGLLIDRYWLQPGRNKELIEEKIKEFESKIPDDKFCYVKTRCPECGKDLK